MEAAWQGLRETIRRMSPEQPATQDPRWYGGACVLDASMPREEWSRVCAQIEAGEIPV